MFVFLGNKLTTNSLDNFRKSLEMQSEGGLLRLCLEVCCVYSFLMLNRSLYALIHFCSNSNVVSQYISVE